MVAEKETFKIGSEYTTLNKSMPKSMSTRQLNSFVRSTTASIKIGDASAATVRNATNAASVYLRTPPMQTRAGNSCKNTY